MMNRSENPQEVVVDRCPRAILPDRSSPEELFEALVPLGRRRAVRHWLTQAVVRGIVWNTPPFLVILGLRHGSGLGLGWLLGAYTAAAFVTCLACLWYRRELITRFADILDARCRAEGRIASAVEFLAEGGLDAYRRLAIRDAGYWLASRGPECLRWHRPLECYAAVPAVLVLYLACRCA